MISKKSKASFILFIAISISVFTSFQFSHASFLSAILDNRIDQKRYQKPSEELLEKWAQDLKNNSNNPNPELEPQSEIVGPSILKLSFLRRKYPGTLNPIVHLFLNQIWYPSATQLLSKNKQGHLYNYISGEDLVSMLRGLYQLDEVPSITFLETFTNALTDERLDLMSMQDRNDLRHYYVAFAGKKMHASAREGTAYRIIAAKAIERLINCGADRNYSLEPLRTFNKKTRRLEEYFSEKYQNRLNAFAQFQTDARNLFIESLHDHAFLRVQPSVLFIREFRKFFVDQSQLEYLSPEIATRAIKDMAKLGLFNQANYGKSAVSILDKWIETAHNEGDFSHFKEPKHLIEFMWALMLIDASLYQEGENENSKSKWNQTLFPFIRDGLQYLGQEYENHRLTFDKNNPQDSFRSHQFFTLRNYLKKIRPYALKTNHSGQLPVRKSTYKMIPEGLRAYLKTWGNLLHKDFKDKKYNRVSEDEINETITYTTSKTQDRVQEKIELYLSKFRPDLKLSTEVWNKNKAAPIDILIQSNDNKKAARKLIKESTSGSGESDNDVSLKNKKNSADVHAAEVDPTLVLNMLLSRPQTREQVKSSSFAKSCAGVATEVDGPDHFILMLTSGGAYSERHRPSDTLSDLFFSKASKYTVKRIDYIEWDQISRDSDQHSMRRWLDSLAAGCRAVK